ncbi:MAG: O-antigen ligase family protein [Nanoarchaeota archaeon]|nr:O-antigen ligase family protein [Nanoarchaeota archaeon]
MEQIILFAFLILFPFGQIIKIGSLNPIDIVVCLGAITAIVKRYKYSKYFNDFLIAAIFSYLLSIFIFKNSQVFIGLLYLVRLTAYFYFYIFVSHFKDKKLLLNSLLAISFFSALFGWIQYFFYPDLTSLKFLGWDDHLYRLVGTYLDPGFTSLIIVFGAVLSFVKKKYLLLAFFIATLAFTYSRAGYLALVVSLFLASFLFKRFKVFLIVLTCFLIIVFLLPRPAGEGVNLARTYSISSRITNYRETFEIFKKSPVFGVGFNNICLARNIYLKDIDSASHSCSGSDSSLLLILATTGIVGFMVFVRSVSKILFTLKRGFYTKVFLVLLSAVFVHSFFVNSLFYPWVMGYLAISASLIEE